MEVVVVVEDRSLAGDDLVRTITTTGEAISRLGVEGAECATGGRVARTATDSFGNRENVRPLTAHSTNVFLAAARCAGRAPLRGAAAVRFNIIGAQAFALAAKSIGATVGIHITTDARVLRAANTFYAIRVRCALIAGAT